MSQFCLSENRTLALWVTDRAKRNPSPGDPQQALKITIACPSEGWGMRVSVYGERKERKKKKDGEDTRAGKSF